VKFKAKQRRNATIENPLGLRQRFLDYGAQREPYTIIAGTSISVSYKQNRAE
jgi:hypothetical protein